MQYLIRGGVDPGRAVLGVGTTVMATGVAATWFGRRAGLLALFGVAGVVARLASYHWFYDDGMMIFLLIAFAVVAARDATPAAWGAFLVVGASLWLPARLTDWLAVELLQQAVWVGAVLAIVRGGDRYAVPVAPVRPVDAVGAASFGF